ncbi:MAG: hypothetical protein HY902_07015 [Deltaproteobacteria bacterium]|nr:hypothetical protein [Deltaproteobacteria bacterium]
MAERPLGQEAATGLRHRVGPWRILCGPLPHGWLAEAADPPDARPDLHIEVVASEPARSSPGDALVTSDSPDQTEADFARGRLRFDWRAGRATWHWPAEPIDEPRSLLLEPSWLATMAILAYRAGGVLMHGATVVGADGAVVVSGASGAGKSTLARHFPGHYLHDDVTLIVPQGGRWLVWYQDAYRPQPGPFPVGVPLRGLHFLGPDRQQTRASAMSSGRAMQALCEQLFYLGPQCASALLARGAQITADLPAFELSHCLADPQSVRIQELFGHLG